jgi:hypothetical protein
MNALGRQADSAGAAVTTSAAPDCRACRHVGVSWQPAMPYLCRLMGFRSRNWPALEVLRADGRPCQGFAPRVVSAAARGGA